MHGVEDHFIGARMDDHKHFLPGYAPCGEIHRYFRSIGKVVETIQTGEFGADTAISADLLCKGFQVGARIFG